MYRPLLIFIIKTIMWRFDDLEGRLGRARVARLARHLVRGCLPVEEILAGWVVGVAMEITSDPDTLAVVNIMLSLFVAEARELQTDSRVLIREFCRNWTDRCIRKLMQGLGMGDLLARPKWGSKLMSQASSRFLLAHQ